MFEIVKNLLFGNRKQTRPRALCPSGKSSLSPGVEYLEDRLTPAVVSHPGALVAMHQPVVGPPPPPALVAHVLPIGIGALNPQPLPPSH